MLRSLLKKYAKDVSGNTAVMLSLAAIPMMLGAGAAVDMIRASNTRTILQAAADSAALAGAVSGKSDDAALQVIVSDYLKANHAEYALSAVKSIKQKMDKTKHSFEVSVDGSMDTGFMFLAGISKLDVGAYSEVELGGNGLEVVMALDNTESMNYEGRLPALKTAAKSLVDTVLDGSGMSGAYVKVGIVPFSNYVNVGLGNRSKWWIDVGPDTSVTANSCWNEYPSATKSNCHNETYTGYVDGVPQTYTTEVCDWNWGAPVEHCGVSTTNYTWNGCVGSRHSPLDAKLVGLGNKYSGVIKDTWGNNVWCAKELTPLTDNKTTLNAAIDAMTGVGNTYIAPGVLWGWNMLDAAEPIVGAKTKTWMKDNKGTKALVLMTDGDNTLSPLSSDYLRHDGGDVTVANNVTADTCENAKKDDITVYTVAFKVTNVVAKDLLRECATSPDMAFTADDATALNDAFNEIAKSLIATRLTK
jgi:Flp pilus assembly protein TadG